MGGVLWWLNGWKTELAAKFCIHKTYEILPNSCHCKIIALVHVFKHIDPFPWLAAQRGNQQSKPGQSMTFNKSSSPKCRSRSLRLGPCFCQSLSLSLSTRKFPAEVEAALSFVVQRTKAKKRLMLRERQQTDTRILADGRDGNLCYSILALLLSQAEQFLVVARDNKLELLWAIFEINSIQKCLLVFLCLLVDVYFHFPPEDVQHSSMLTQGTSVLQAQ